MTLAIDKMTCVKLWCFALALLLLCNIYCLVKGNVAMLSKVNDENNVMVNEGSGWEVKKY